jgi:hypothetical protein
MKNWKSKVDVLRNKINAAKALQKHLEIVSGKKTAEPVEQANQPKIEKTLSLKDALTKRKILKEQKFVNEIANIPAYKSAEYHTLDLLNRKTNNINPLDKNKFSGIIHTDSVKLAKNRLANIIRNLMKDIQKTKK